ncbi:MAG: hypothetical protein HY719_11075 [Planctomycetes bacterium]|nr:hypothetical protein [Planctomycetota bacterium]
MVFLKSRRRTAHAVQVDIEAEKQSWLHSVETIQDTMVQWLRQAREENLLDVTKVRLPAVDGRFGVYESWVLKIFVGSSVVDVRPVESDYLGWKGRVDMECSVMQQMILRDSEEIWHFASLSPSLKTTPFNEVNFKHVLVELLQ